MNEEPLRPGYCTFRDRLGYQCSKKLSDQAKTGRCQAHPHPDNPINKRFVDTAFAHIRNTHPTSGK